MFGFKYYIMSNSNILKIGSLLNKFPNKSSKVELSQELKDKLVSVVSAYGKSNSDKDRDIIKDKTGKGNDFQILNADYKLNSSFGKYEEDFTSWRIYPNIKVTDNVITTNGNFNSTWFIYKHSNENEINEMNIKVSGIPEGGIIRYFYIPDETATMPVSYNISEDGVYHLPKSKLSSNRVSIGFTVSSSYDWNNIRIEQIPLFKGAFTTDGIDDLIVSTKTIEEMGITDEVTVISMIHQIDNNKNNFITTNNFRTTNKVVGRNIVSNIEKTGIYGWYKENIQKEDINIINNILGDKNDYIAHSSPSTNTTPINSSKFYVTGYVVDENNYNELSSVAWYWTIIAKAVLTTDEINQVIAYYNLDRTLRPDILCNITKQGITNDNHAEFNNKLIDYSGNGRDIQMNNLAWKGGSGIAAKPFETIKDYTIVSDEARQKLTIYNEFSYKIKSNTPSYYWTVQSIIRDNTSYQVTIITDKDCYWINATSFINSEGNKESIRKKYPVLANTPTQVIICGLDQFEYPEGIEPTSAVSYVNLEYAGEITITFIPSYKGGILLDGINDFGQFVGDLGLKDYTFIADRAYDRIVLEQAPFIASTQTNGQAPFLMEYLNEDTYVYPHSFGTTTKTTNLNIQRQISYQSTYVYNGNSISKGTSVDTGDGLTIGNSGSTGLQYSPLCLWSLMLFPYSMSEFLIERQLKKHKLGTLYPNMVEFRPVIKANNDYEIVYTAIIKPDNWQEISIGDYVTVGKSVAIKIKLNIPLEVTNVSSNSLADVSFYKEETDDNVYTIYGRILDGKSPQKITMTIEQDENYVKFEPVITSNVEYVRLDFYLNNYQKRINIGDYIPKDAYLRANFYLKNNVDELTVFTFNGVNIGYKRSSVDDTAFNINQIYNYDSPQEVNITIDEYIRYEDIVQPYPVLLRFNDENGNEVSWGGKFRVGSTITRIGSASDSNLLPNIYNIFGLLLNGNQVTSSKVIVEKTMVFKAKSAYIFDNNEPKCILSPSRLRIPNSSYKILGHIPDISGHGNHGKINNSAYAEGSGVNADGSYQLDGVDDFITIPTTVGGKQVLMKVNWNTINSIIYDQRTNGGFAIFNSDFDTNENKVPAYRARNIGGSTYIDGILNKYIYASELKNITHNIVELHDPKLNTGTLNPKIGSSFLNSNYTQMSLYDFMLFDEISTDDKIEELNKYIGIEAKVELPPYYWDTYGKTNSDADRDTIQQRGIAVGDYDLINYNHAYEGMSGYNGYPVVFGESKTWEAQGTKDGDKYYIYTSNANKFNITQIKISSSLFYTYIKRNGELTSGNKDIPSFNLKVTGLDYDKFYLAYYYLKSADVEVRNVINITSDGIYELPKSFASDGSLTETNSYIGLSFIKKSSEIPDIIQNVNVTIEVLPEYENGLVYDGVEDFSKNANIPALTDYTYILKRQILKGIANSAVMYKGNITVNQGGAFICNYCEPSDTNLFTDFSFGGLLRSNDIDKPIIYGTKTSVNGDSITPGENIDTVGINVGKWVNYLPMVFYKLILYPKTIPLLQINFLKNLMEKDEIINLNNPIFIQK